jgi:sugar lactone lactonase YvrE
MLFARYAYRRPVRRTSLSAMNLYGRSLGLTASMFALAMGCGNPNPNPTTDAATDAMTDAMTNPPTDAAADVSTPPADAAVDGSTPPPGDAAADAGAGLRVLTSFNAMMGQLAEGIAVRDNALYVGFAPTGQIVRIDAAGMATPFAQVPIPPSMAAPNGFLLGLIFDRAGNLYAAAPSFSPMFQAGVYRVSSAGGMATLFARDTMGRMNFPNGMDFDATGNLYVTDSGSGSVFRISPDGMTVTQWAQSPVLTGVMGANPCGPGAGFPIGANGLTFDAMGMNAYVTNTDRATVVRIPVGAGGVAGTPAVLVAQNCEALAGADGLTRGPDGALYATANAAPAITRIAVDGTVSVLERGGLLDSPASIAFGTLGGAARMFITNAAFTSAQTPGGMPRPGVLVRSAP